MQQLHLVGYTTDHDGLIFSTRKGSKSGSFIVPLDDRLRGVIEEAGRRRDGEPDADEGEAARSGRRRTTRQESTLSPRDMQVRLRAGRSIAEVAAEAGVDEEWVARFAVPILAEQAQVVDRARSLTSSKPRLGPSSQPLGLSVWWNLADKGLRLPDDEFDGGWSAYHLRESAWMVRYTYSFRRKQYAAEWEVDLRTGDLVPRNRQASDLGYIEPGRRKRPSPVLPAVPAARPAPRPSDDGAAEAAAPAKAPGSRGPAKRSAGKKAAAKKATAKKATAKKATAKKATAKKATSTRTAAAKKAAAKKAAAKKAAAKKAAATRTAAAKKAAVKKAAAKKAAATRTAAAKKAAAKKATAKKPAAKKATAKKATAKRPAATRTATKRAATKKATAKKTPAARKPAARRAPAEKAPAKRPRPAKRAPRRPATAPAAPAVARPTGARRQSRGGATRAPAAARPAAPVEPAPARADRGSGRPPPRRDRPAPRRDRVVAARSEPAPPAEPAALPAASENGAPSERRRPVRRIEIGTARPGGPDTGADRVVEISSAAATPRPTILAPRAEQGGSDLSVPTTVVSRPSGLRARLRGRRAGR